MTKSEALALVELQKIVAIIRTKAQTSAVETARALYRGGIRVVEISLTTPGALEAITLLRQDGALLGDAREATGAPEALVGVGTVLDAAQCRAAIAAGAQFIVTPNTDREVICMAGDHDLPIFSGAFTATEVVTALRCGADVIKIFPADAVGPSYIKALHGPLPGVRLLPTGGVSEANATEWLRAGAFALGVGGALTGGADEGKLEPITLAARRLLKITER